MSDNNQVPGWGEQPAAHDDTAALMRAITSLEVATCDYGIRESQRRELATAGLVDMDEAWFTDNLRVMSGGSDRLSRVLSLVLAHAAVGSLAWSELQPRLVEIDGRPASFERTAARLAWCAELIGRTLAEARAGAAAEAN